jgi:hypothetical protein
MRHNSLQPKETNELASAREKSHPVARCVTTVWERPSEASENGIWLCFVKFKLRRAPLRRTFGSHQTAAPNPSTVIAAGAQGRHVRVQFTSANCLSLAEVQVFGQCHAASLWIETHTGQKNAHVWPQQMAKARYVLP